MAPSRSFSLRRPPLFVVAGVGLAVLAGCASQDDLSALRREQRMLARRLADTRADVESLRVAVNRIQGKMEDSGASRSTRMPPPDLENRLPGDSAQGRPLAPEPVPAATPAGPSLIGSFPPPGSLPEATARPAEPYSPADDVPRSVDIQKDLARGSSESYREGLALYQKGDYPRAIQTLRGFVNKEPKSELVPSAQYWIGDSYFAQKRYNEAILAYNEILVSWPKSERVPAALLRQGVSFAELGDKIDARLILQKLIADYPNTEEAASAKRKLLALGS